jgi:hypothetical protein
VESTWLTQYDVSRDGIGLIPWFFAAMWLAGICAGGVGFKKTQAGRGFLSVWLFAWVVMGGVGIGNIFYQYVANYHALRAGSCTIVEGPVINFHRQNPWKKGDSESFSVRGHQFSYSAAMLGGGGLRNSDTFSLPLENGLYVRIWYRRHTICRFDARH